MASDSWNGTLLQLSDVMFTREWADVLSAVQVISVGTGLQSGQGDHGTSLSLPPSLPPSLSLSLFLSLPPSSFLYSSFIHFLPTCENYHFFFIFALLQSGYLSGSTPFDEVQLESAISGVIYEIIEREKTVSHAASNALMCYLKQVDNSHNRCAPSRLQRLQAVLLSFSINISVFLKFYQYLW